MQTFESATMTSDHKSQTAGADRPTAAPGKPKPEQLPPYKVLLHNDEVNAMDYVVVTIADLTSKPTKPAPRCCWSPTRNAPNCTATSSRANA